MKIEININDFKNSYLFELIRHITEVDKKILIDIDIEDYEYLCRKELELYKYEDLEHIKIKHFDEHNKLFNIRIMR